MEPKAPISDGSAISTEPIGGENVLESKNRVAAERGTSPTRYSLLSRAQIRWIALLVGVATMFSPLTANIYLPCVPLLQQDYETTLQLINTTITAYVLVQSIAPAFFSQLAESLGRRPVYLITFTIFVGASVGLAVQTNYVSLLVLRMLQSAGSSVSTSIGYAVIADMAAPSERGRLLGPVMVTVNLGPVIAPVIGGPMCNNLGWRWIFWFLTITGSFFLVAMAAFLPETGRKIVGNGSVEARGINRPLLPFLIPKAEAYVKPQPVEYASNWKRVAAYIPNPFKCVMLVFQRDSACVLSVAGLFYSSYYIMQASLPPLFKDAYGYNETQIGLCYLALSIGVIFGSQIQAKLMDWNYRKTAKQAGWEIDRQGGDDLSQFPIERARARLAWLFMTLQCACILGYGWSVHFRVHPSVPLIFMFLEGCCGWVQSWNTLMVEIHRDSPSTASAASSLVRGLFAAAGVAVMEPLYGALGVGPFFSLVVGVVWCVGQLMIWVIEHKCMSWRLERESLKEDKRSMRS
ncbi:MFS general substrate transporter [Apiospora arundinis]